MLSDQMRDFILSRPDIMDEVDGDNVQLWPISVDVIDYSILAFRQTGNDQQVLLNGGTGLNTETMSFICIGKSPENALALAKAVELDLVGYVGYIGSVYCVGVQKIGLSDEYDQETGAQVAVLNLNFYTRGLEP